MFLICLNCVLLHCVIIVIFGSLGLVYWSFSNISIVGTRALVFFFFFFYIVDLRDSWRQYKCIKAIHRL